MHRHDHEPTEESVNHHSIQMTVPGIVLGLLLLLASPLQAETAPDTSRTGFLKHRLELGYRGVSTQGEPGRAAEYFDLSPGPTAALDVRAGEGTRNFLLGIDYLTDKNYSGEAHADLSGRLRLNLRSQALFHNLDHYPAERPDAIRPGATVPTVTFTDHDPGADYGVKVAENEVVLRVKPWNFPAHFNLRYWRLEREGKEQLRFVDEGHGATAGSCADCHVQSRTRTIDRITEEVSGLFDAHLGYFDLSFEQLYREYRDREPIPVDEFGAHNRRTGPADLQHDEEPDSTLASSTVKLHTSLSGGLNAAASGTIAKMKNRSDLLDVQGVEAETDLRKAAGDLSWTPVPWLSAHLRYRWLDQESDNSDLLTVPSLTYDSTLEVRDAIDLTRAFYESTLVLRPLSKMTLKAEYRREEIDRSNTGGPVLHVSASATAPSTSIDPFWDLPEEEVIDRYRASLFWRVLPRNQLKINFWHQYQTSDDPAYQISVEEGHQSFAGLDWSPSRHWGITLQGRLAEERNTDYTAAFWSPTMTAAPINATEPFNYTRDRRHEQQDLAAMVWLQPTAPLSLGFHYGDQRLRTLQDLVFGSIPNAAAPGSATDYYILDDDVEFSQRVRTATVTANWRITEQLRAILEGRHIRSSADYDPDFFRSALNFSGGYTSPVDSTLLRELSRIDIRQVGASAGLEWDFAQGWNCALRYTYDDYDDVDRENFDGTAQTCMLTLARSW